MDPVALIQEALGERASKANLFEGSAVVENSKSSRLPAYVKCWVSNYAIMCLWPVRANHVDALREATYSAMEWLEPILRVREKRGELVDGYLVFSLPQRPSSELAVAARALEGDGYLCRKYVVWPDELNPGAASIDKITSVGLPPSPSQVNAAGLPALDSDESDLLELLNSEENVRAVFEKLKAGAPQLGEPYAD